MTNNNTKPSAASTSKKSSLSSVPTRVGKDAVTIDPNALRHLIDTLRAKLPHRNQGRNG
jgi:hypothetical protein